MARSGRDARGQLRPPCPLCDAAAGRPGWAGSTQHLGQTYAYRECLACGSQFCEPMPGAVALAAMYGTTYLTAFGSAEGEHAAIRDTERVLAWLRRLGGGRFVDFGCGSGDLLMEVARAGWEAIGVEADVGVARQVSEKTGLRVVSSGCASDLSPADVLHLGDVIEHLTDASAVLRRLLALLKPGGVLLAQGPLEANPCLFTLAVRASKVFRRARRLDMPPYHVILATRHGQEAFFDGQGLESLEFLVSEVAWPAPTRLSIAVLSEPRALAFYLLRIASRALSRLRPRAWGNRYFYAGRFEA